MRAPAVPKPIDTSGADKFIRAHMVCVMREAASLAHMPEPAETIVTAAFAGCGRFEAALRTYLFETLRDGPSTDQLIGKLRESSRQLATSAVLRARDGKPRSAPPPDRPSTAI